MANIVYDPLIRLVPDISRVLVPGGVMIFSGLSLKEKDAFLRVLEEYELIPFDEVAKGDWWGVAATRPAGKS
jgi:ribosomal protein L11 methyltransferase